MTEKCLKKKKKNECFHFEVSVDYTNQIMYSESNFLDHPKTNALVCVKTQALIITA